MSTTFSGVEFAIGGLSAVCAGIFTNPLEVIKIRMQLQGELKAKGQFARHYKNVFHAGYTIFKYDGIVALQAGLVPALWFQLFLNGIRLGSYEIISKKGILRDEEGKIVFYKSVIAGASCGVLGAWTSSPFYLIKTQLQSQAAQEIAFGHQHGHNGMISGFKNVYKTGGISKGLFRGATAAIPRAGVGSTAQLTSFSYCKEWLNTYEDLNNHPILKAFISSMVGGAVVALTMTPFDLISTRIYNQGVDAQGRGLIYKGYFDCIVKIFKTEGFLGFYKGIGPSYLRLGPHTVLTLVFWDNLNSYYKSYVSYS